MSFWTILGLTQTTDIRAIKRAYAAKLRAIQPDEQPEEFQRLKAAFDSALFFAKNHSSADTTTMVSTNFGIEEHSPHQQAFEIPAMVSFREQLQQVVDDDRHFYDLSVWQKLTETATDWSIDEYMDNSYTIQLFLVERYPCLSKEIIRFLFKAFDLIQLKDHIATRFISADFIALKREIFHVPPFSFRIAKGIPKERRKEYFYLRYEIYQMIAKKQNHGMSVEARINDCADIFAEDSELWTLQLIDLLDKSDSFLDTEIDRETFQTLLEQIKELDQNPTSLFLTNYFNLLTKSTDSETIFDWHKEQLIIPEELFLLMLGTIFFQTQQYVPAFNLWKQLDLSRKIALKKHFKVISPYLMKQEKKECRKLLKEIRKVAATPAEVTATRIKHVAIYILALATIFWFLAYAAEHPQTPYKFRQSPAAMKVADTKESLPISSTVEEETDATEEERINLFGETIEERFVHYFYASNDPEGKQHFIDTHVIDEALKKRLGDYVNQDTFIYKEASAFHYKTSKVGYPEKQMTAVYFDNELLCILESSIGPYTLYDAYGAQWHQLSDEDYQHMLKTIVVTPERSTTIFLKKFLFSNNKEQNLLEYTDYLSENIQSVIKINLNEPISENLKAGYLYQIEQPEIKFIVSDQNQENEEKLILTFDDQGRVAHVFGPNWEEVNEEMIHYPNRIAFKNIRNLLEEPDE
ncbi:hypothetical protein [Enterococcus termitis]|uniref:J domain-containing protein n=1 Tax=Enterococcus termitis TaxID=332950 RepID=A0A1E5GVH4_9ENTE|nr:hypothetical protein [Enterococcus termitis]OEG16714.1 hypothetical protein BCR25_03705 [Enterococcus termitis]